MIAWLIICFHILVFSIGKAYVNNTVKFSSLVKANFCNKVFAAWDYKLRNSRAVKLKKAFIKIDLQVCFKRFTIKAVAINYF